LRRGEHTNVSPRRGSRTDQRCRPSTSDTGYAKVQKFFETAGFSRRCLWSSLPRIERLLLFDGSGREGMVIVVLGVMGFGFIE
jgi:hypothetical protein